ncbi:MAG: serine protease [Bacteroidetes bacterium SW_9_63_38]|nr:MAG: serine protease [Bacteroidetes bacterium SW_9_63_38]
MSTKSKVSVAVFVGGAFLAGILFATIGANLFGLGDTVGTAGQAATLDGSTAVEQTAEGPRSLESAFTKVSEAVNPAVVQIRAQKVVERRMPNPFQGTPFEEFFGGPGGQQREFRSQGLGSGVIIQSDGHIVTNNHVVEDAKQLSVVMKDGTEYDAEIVGTDPFSDLAVIKVDATDMTAVSFGDSNTLKTGQWVLAFGSPLSENLNNSVTAGIVSSVGRLQQTGGRGNTQGGVQNFVQTDAAINPGNSGGPLVNLNGELVGINTAIISNTGGYQGIGFAIPSNTVENVVTQIIGSGNVKRAFLGINYGPASQTLIKNEDLPSGSAVISRIQDGTPAAEAGLKAGDIITAINGQTLDKYLQVSNLISSMTPGEEATLTINRNGKRKEMSVTLGSREEGMASAEEENESGEAPSREQLMEELGLNIQDISPEIARQLGLDNTKGVVITDVDQSNPMIRNSGLEPRQVIVEIAEAKTPDAETFQEVYSEVPAGKAFRVVVRLPGGFVDVTSLRKPKK